MQINNHDKVRQWVKQGESDTLEFKVQIPDATKAARAICALANTRGGYLVAGIADDGEIVGIVEPDKDKALLTEAALVYCVPPVQIEIWEYTEDFLTVLAAYVPESNHKPHKAINKNGLEQAFIRTGNKTMPAARMVEKVLRNEVNTPHSLPPDTTNLNSKEKGLLEYLAKKETITLKQFARLVNISERRARRMLVQLTLGGYIRIHTSNKEDFYTLS